MICGHDGVPGDKGKLVYHQVDMLRGILNDQPGGGYPVSCHAAGIDYGM
jgi:hypothetical protein